MKKKYILTTSVVGFGLAACNGNCGSSPSPSPTMVSAGVSVPGSLFGINSLSNSSENLNGALKAASVSGIAYYLPIVNTGSTALGVASVEATNPTVWTVDASECTNVASGSSCNLAVGFDGTKVTAPAALNTLVTITYTNNSSVTVPMTGAVVAPGQLHVQMPGTVVPDADGNAYGVITVFNGTTDAQKITSSTISPTSQQGVTWTFTINCDGAGGNQVAPLQACSVAFVYHVASGITPPAAPISVSVPVVNNNPVSPNYGQSTVLAPTSQSLPPQTASNPAPYITYTGGAVSLASGSGSFVLQNVGNGALSGITFADLAGLSQTNNCANLAANAVCSVNLSGTPTGNNVQLNWGSSGVINVPVVAQALAVSPSAYNFGSAVYSGTQLSTTVSVTNLGSAVLTNVNGAMSGDTSDFIINTSASTCPVGNGSHVIPAFTSCSLVMQYTAPTTAGTQQATLNLSADEQTTQTTSLSATSIISSWSNLIPGLSGYTNSGAAILSLAGDTLNSLLFFGNSLAPNVPGARQVWQISGSTATNASLSQSGYDQSAPTALAGVSSSGFTVGHYDGSLQNCAANVCTTVIPNNASLGITSLVLNGSNEFISYSDKTSGTTGQLIYYNGSTPSTISAVTGAVGRMASDGILTYVPIHNLNATGTLASYTNNTGVIASSNLAPSGLSSSEFISALFFGNNTLYAGTSMGNVFSSALPVSNQSWTKLTATPLSTQSFISDMALNNNNILFVGLVNLNSPTNGGGVFQLNNGSFIPSQGYTDQSSVGAMLLFNGKVNVATYNGNLWQTQ